MKLNRFLPSPAMVVACIALFVAMGGSAAALATGVIDGREVKNYSLTGKDVKKDGLGGVTIKEDRLGTVPSASGLQRSVVVGPLGQFVRGKDVTSVGRTGEGRYLVVFRSNVQGCAYVASLGDPSVSVPPVGPGRHVGRRDQRQRRAGAHRVEHRQRGRPAVPPDRELLAILDLA